ncbi:hypothetical protein ACQ4M3_12860 [Leptolyngbya sp. AN03gr2]|uniref:hypothetical protein n=1 Tax=unclassified Leptolyngbya TaxID=2650499 RepID=UPI003D312EDF
MNQTKIDQIFDRAATLNVTLNHKPAVLAGRLLPFGWVCALDGSEKYEWSWDTIGRIVNQGGNFRTQFTYEKKRLRVVEK